MYNLCKIVYYNYCKIPCSSFQANGFIHYIDFMEIMARRGDQTEIITEDELAEVFSVFDMDGCGRITVTDLMEAMAALGNDISEQEATELIQKADVDEDGMVNVTGNKSSFCRTCFPNKDLSNLRWNC